MCNFRASSLPQKELSLPSTLGHSSCEEENTNEKLTIMAEFIIMEDRGPSKNHSFKDEDVIGMHASSADEIESTNVVTDGILQVPSATTDSPEIGHDNASMSGIKVATEDEGVNVNAVVEDVKAGVEEITHGHVSSPEEGGGNDILATRYGDGDECVDEKATSKIVLQGNDGGDIEAGGPTVDANNDLEDAGDNISLAAEPKNGGEDMVKDQRLSPDETVVPVVDANNTAAETAIPNVCADNDLEEAGDRILLATPESKAGHGEDEASISPDGNNNPAEASGKTSLASLASNPETDGTAELPVDEPLKANASGSTCMSFETASSVDSLDKDEPVDEEAALGNSEKTTDTNLQNNNRFRRRFLAVAMLGCLLLAIVLPIAFIVSGSMASSTTTDDEEEAHSVPSGDLVPGMMQSTFDSMRNPFSPQTRAYEWIASDPNWDAYEGWRKQQRFAMACLFYSFSTRFPLFYEKHECEWRYRRQVVLCTTDGYVRGLSWTEMMWTELHFHVDSFLPAELALLPLLERLDFSGSTFRVRREGEYTHVELDSLLPTHIPSALSALRNLKATGCSGLQGSIPSQLGLFTRLTRLDLGDNELTSTIPTEIGLLTGLQRLDLRGNALTATLPSELGSLDDLGALWVQNNDLSGTIPVQLGELPLLSVFMAEDNELERALPPGFCGTGPMAQLVTDWCWDHDMCCY